MTPADVEAMHPDVYRAFVDYANGEIRAHNRAMRKKR